jgi:2-C-methyl-D-erythritol 4-phosphate cytidylyltransferase
LISGGSRPGSCSIDRKPLWLAQTPQAFTAAALRDAHERAAADGFEGSDDALLLERLLALDRGELRR